MDIIHPRCAGIDIHKKTLVVCCKITGKRETRTLPAYTQGIRKLGEWLSKCEVTHVAMESTGVYWKPVWNLLEEEFGSIVRVLANAEHVKQVPGRKTDVNDAQWLAELLSCGLIRGSRVPERAERETQELVRLRRSFLEDRAGIVKRIQKTLEGANVKLTSVVTDVTGKAGMQVVKALIAGKTAPTQLLELTRTGLKANDEEILQALEGSMGEHQRLVLDSLIRLYESYTDQIERLDSEAEERLRPFDQTLKRLDGVPGVGRRTAEEILAYAGPTLESFPTARHLASWAGLCPGNSISAGKKTKAKKRRGSNLLKRTMIQSAWAAQRTKGSYYKALYHRKKGTRGAQKAIVTVAHSLLTAIYHIVRREQDYAELGEDYHKLCNREEILARRIRELRRLGYSVTVEPLAAA